MPELPEVENLRRGLERLIVGQKIRNVLVHKPKLVSGTGNKRSPSLTKTRQFIDGLIGEKFTKVERRAKNIIFHLTHGKILFGHLKMSGQFAYSSKKKNEKIIGGHPIELSEKSLPNKHTHIVFELEHGTLYYNDTRMFGYLLYYPSHKEFEKEGHFSLYGLEPLNKEFTSSYFTKEIRNKSPKIKALLMDQKIVTGLGNIYADESLFEARIHPERRASSVSQKEGAKLYRAIRRILTNAIKEGGSSVATYRLIDTTKGNYARKHKVYGKAGKPCSRCKTKLEQTIVGGRTTVFCPVCQK